jgi:hypothetical protein
MNREPLKQCPGCKQWLTLHQILHDSNISPQGIIIDPHDYTQCYYHFIHLRGNCLSSFLVHSATIRQATSLAKSTSLSKYHAHCPGFCTEMTELATCRADCTLRLHREFILALRPLQPDLTPELASSIPASRKSVIY